MMLLNRIAAAGSRGITSKVVVRVLFGFTLDRAKPIAYRAYQRASARESRDSQVVEKESSSTGSHFSFFVETREKVHF